MKKIQRLLAIFLFLCTFKVPVTAGFLSVSDAQVIQAGRSAHMQVMRKYGSWFDPEQQERVERLGGNLTRFSNRPEIHYRFYLLNSNILNAMATPDGSIHITRGLLTNFTDDQELSFVLGHEMTHVERRHGKQMIEKAMKTRMFANLLISGVARNNLMGILGVDGAGYWLTMKYSRDFETQADQGGMELIQKAGMDPHYGPKALEHLASLSKGSPSIVQQYFSSHPLNDVRIKEARQYADHLATITPKYIPQQKDTPRI